MPETKKDAFLPYGRQIISDADVAAVAEVLRSAFLTQGPTVEKFEAALAEHVGARYAVAFNSGTSALHGAYFAAGIAKDSTVLTTPITFVATANASLYLGGRVQFADVDPETILLDPAAASAIDDRTVRAIVPVHFGGQVADMAALSKLARERGWLLIEDAAHAIGARYRVGKTEYAVGACTHSAMCCFSFHPVKHITTGEGGAVTTNDESLYRRLSRFRTHGITRDPSELTRNDGAWYYEQHDLGFNYRITDFQCALGLSQLRRLDEFVNRRRELAARYDRLFESVAGVQPLEIPSWSTGSYHLYVIRVAADRRRAIFDALRSAQIGVNVHYIPVYHQPFYRAHGFAKTSLPSAEAYYAEAITLPLHAGMSDDDVARVVSQVTAASSETSSPTLVN